MPDRASLPSQTGLVSSNLVPHGYMVSAQHEPTSVRCCMFPQTRLLEQYFGHWIKRVARKTTNSVDFPQLCEDRRLGEDESYSSLAFSILTAGLGNIHMVGIILCTPLRS